MITNNFLILTHDFSPDLLKLLITLSRLLCHIHLPSFSIISTLLYSFFFTFSLLCKCSIFQFRFYRTSSLISQLFCFFFFTFTNLSSLPFLFHSNNFYIVL